MTTAYDTTSPWLKCATTENTTAEPPRDYSLSPNSREEHVGRAVTALRFGHHKDCAKAIWQAHQPHVITDERPDAGRGCGAQVEGAGSVPFLPVGTPIARRAEPDVGIESRAARGVMTEVVPEHANGAVAGNRECWKKRRGALADGNVRLSPVQPRVIRTGGQNRGEIVMVFEVGDIQGIAADGRGDVLAGEPQSLPGPRIDAGGVSEARGVDRL